MDENREKSGVAQNEEKVLEFWNKSKTFEKSEGKEASKGSFVFYDGPPFATGLPHYGHLLAGTIKDAIPRYQTMLGKKIKRIWGWDCHGLPLENIIEEDLNLKTKKDIEVYGIEKFNEAAGNKVLYYADDWEKIVPRLGRWVDMKAPYKTMDTSYTESVWWSFKEIFNKGLIYEGFKSMHYCPRCGTTLSNFEVNQGYKDIKDLSVIAKFELEEEPNTFVLAWTTTPWTLPGNMALALNPKEEYLELQSFNKNKKEKFIISRNVFFDQSTALKEEGYSGPENETIYEFFGEQYEITISVIKGSELIGKKYKPVFDTYINEEFENKENAWKIYGADFVTMEEGTGIVHIAPAFGTDDLALAQKENIPIIHHVDLEGKFKKEVKDFAGMYVKQKEDPNSPKANGQAHQATDIEIIKYLSNKKLLFSKEKIEHSYPHCWRCDTPLLNYATSSWFLKATEIKDKIISENQKIKWVPTDIRDGRFGKWLEGMRDWAISRSRYWGAPLPVWKCTECSEIKVIGSIDEIKKEIKEKGSHNQYFVIRHGEAENNTLDICSNGVTDKHHLTEKGKEQIKESAQELKNPNPTDGQVRKIDLIITSPYIRTKESAEILAKELGVKDIIEDKRIGEINLGEFRGEKCNKYHEFFSSEEEYFIKVPKGGESFSDIKNRVSEFLYDIDKNHSNKNILIVGHQNPTWLLEVGSQGLNIKESVEFVTEKRRPENAEWRELDFIPLPHNKNYELDLHRPYIDEIKFECSCNGKMVNIKEVFDCWYESGSMPYASKHYPFENLDIFDPKKSIGYPADFIAEGLDQTRGWFYSMLVLSVALFDKSAYSNVIVNGLVLAEDGQKMSKSKKNFPDPMLVVDKYGADALRYYLLASPLMKAEDLNFTEKGVDEVLKKNILRFKNTLSFYELYKDEKTEDLDSEKSENILDQWILARLNELIQESTKALNNYEIDKATRPIADFIDDLSTWYLRRSRDRFKAKSNPNDLIARSTEGGFREDIGNDRDFAIATTKYVLEILSKILAPFMPFIAEEIWQNVTENNFENEDRSVHLEEWPIFKDKIDENLLVEMKVVRDVISLGLEIRAKEGIKVRQPLRELKVKSSKLKGREDLLELVKDELNVKEINFDKNIENEVKFDLEITLELKQEGDFREFLRNIQRLRKEKGLVPSDMINISIETDEKGKILIEKFSSELKRIAGIKEIQFIEVKDDPKPVVRQGQEIIIEDYYFIINII